MATSHAVDQGKACPVAFLHWIEFEQIIADLFNFHLHILYLTA